MKRILVLQTAFTGDAILATALLEKLHEHFPDARLDLVVRKGNETLFSGHPFLHRVLVWDKRKNKLTNLFRLLRTIRGNEYDHVINLQRFLASGVLTAFSGGNDTIGFDKNPLSFLFSKKVAHVIGDNRHETVRNQELILHLTDERALKPKLYPSESDRERVRPLQSSSYYCIAPGSVWFTKTWPEHKWAELIRARSKQYPGDTCYLLGAPSESGICERILQQCPEEKVVNVSGKLSLLQSAALMQESVMNYVNDSAPLHLASAMNAPVTAVYCSTVPSFGFGPLSADSRVVETNETLPCRPCGLHGFRSCPKSHFRCAESIPVERVLTR